MKEVERPGQGEGRPAVAGRPGGENGVKGPRPGRLLAVFKAVVLLGLMSVTAYGMFRGGFYGAAEEEPWLPVAVGILGMLAVTLFARGFYRDVPRVGWILVALLAALAAVKGLSMVWTISETETVKEVLRSSMYVGVFVLALAALTSGRQVGPLVDIAILIVSAVAGYGLLQKISPIEYPVNSIDGVRVDSTLGYANSLSVILGMGVVLALTRMSMMRHALLRGLYAALVFGFLVVLYLTVSRGGIGALGIGLISFFVLTHNRLQTLANLFLVAVPGAWLLWQMQGLEGLMRADASNRQKIADGVAFGTDLIVALAVAFALQVGYFLLMSRYELMPDGRRALGALVLAGAVLVAGAGAFVVVKQYGGIGQTYERLVSNPDQTENVGQRLASLSVGYRAEYWRVGWEAWKERPLTGTGAGTFRYTWLEGRSGEQGVKQIHNLYLEQGTETGLFAFLALAGFVGVLVGYLARSALRSGPHGVRRLLLAGLTSALVIYIVSSVIEWHWYIPAVTIFFFILAAIAVKFASREDWGVSGPQQASHPTQGNLRENIAHRWRQTRG
ncbi:MAG TPA: O-antigen ligase family protein [Rubrobacteraceae bacterium]|nr:O-antigen ligase family protein [Rubrobacteraceae bacterium]